MGVSSNSARRALSNAGINLVRINARALAVEEIDLAGFIHVREGYAGMGRPRKEGVAEIAHRLAETVRVTVGGAGK